MPTIQIQSKQELEFILFCVDFVAQKLNQRVIMILYILDNHLIFKGSEML